MTKLAHIPITGVIIGGKHAQSPRTVNKKVTCLFLRIYQARSTEEELRIIKGK